MNYTKTDIENILNIYEGNTNKSFSQYSYVEFLSDKAIDAWKYCVSTNYKNKIAITSRIINNDILITVISPPVYKDLQITKLFATNADGILEEVQLN